MTLVKLKLDVSVPQLSLGISLHGSASFTKELREIEWFSSKDQVAGTLPFSFRERYRTTVSIIDASEVFIQTPSDLMLQSTAWSNYKHHNTM